MASLVDRSSDARFDQDDRITKLRGDFTLPDADSLEDAVVSFLDEHSDELHLPNGRSTMEVVHRADTPTGGVVRLQQQVDSIPVFNSEVIVATDQDNRVRQIDLHRQARLNPAAPGGEDRSAAVSYTHLRAHDDDVIAGSHSGLQLPDRAHTIIRRTGSAMGFGQLSTKAGVTRRGQ